MEPPAATVATLAPGLPSCRDIVSECKIDRSNQSAYLVAGNVGGGVAVGANEAVVLVGSAPGNAIRLARGSLGRGEALVLGAVNLDGDDTAVGVGRSGKGAQKGGGLHEGHVD